jgi:hypothetical protein
MHSLDEALDRFNRKERNLLVREMLADGRLPPLTKHFCDQVGQKCTRRSNSRPRSGGIMRLRGGVKPGHFRG